MLLYNSFQYLNWFKRILSKNINAIELSRLNNSLNETLFMKSFPSDELNIEIQSGIRWDDLSNSILSVSIFRWTNNDSSFSFAHFSHSFIPSFNNLACSNHKFKWFASISWWIEFLPISQCSSVMNDDSASFWREALSISRLLCLNLEWHMFWIN